MKAKFLFITFLLLFARGCDFYSTSLWFFDSPEGEQNLLYKLFDLNWNGLLITNAIVVAGIIYCFYYYCFKYKAGVSKVHGLTLKQFVSTHYFGQKDKFYSIFFRAPRDRKILIAHSGYVLVRVVIVGSFLATIHNLCQFYDLEFYNQFRELVGRPLFVIYGLCILSFAFFSVQLWRKEYREAVELADFSNDMNDLYENSEK